MTRSRTAGTGTTGRRASTAGPQAGPRTGPPAAPPPGLVVAGVLGGVLHAVKGGVLLLGGPDLSLVPTMLLLFALGLLGLHRAVAQRSGWARVGLAAAWSGVGFGIASLVCQVVGWRPEDAADPVVADIAYGGGTLSILLGLLALGVAWARDRSILPPWRWVPLVVAVVWFPLEGLTAVLPDGWGLLLAGLTWVAVALAPVLSRRDATEVPSV